MVPKPSHVWQYFDKIQRNGNPFAKCRLCGLELKSHMASNAKRHLRTEHGPSLYHEIEQADRAEDYSKPHSLELRIGDLVQVRTLAIKWASRKSMVLTSELGKQVLADTMYKLVDDRTNFLARFSAKISFMLPADKFGRPLKDLLLRHHSFKGKKLRKAHPN